MSEKKIGDNWIDYINLPYYQLLILEDEEEIEICIKKLFSVNFFRSFSLAKKKLFRFTCKIFIQVAFKWREKIYRRTDVVGNIEKDF